MPTHPSAVSPYNRPVQPPSVYSSSLPPPFPPTSMSPSPGYDMYSVPPHPHMYMMQVSLKARQSEARQGEVLGRVGRHAEQRRLSSVSSG